MVERKELSKILRILENHEQRIRSLEGKKETRSKGKVKLWYKQGSTIEKIVSLIEGRFFNTTHGINEIITELKTRDYHLKPADLTLPLRKIVRKGLLMRTKKRTDGSTSKTWLYVKG